MRNKKILGIAALAAVAVVGGSFAYFNQTMTAENPFNTGTYNTLMQEDFNPKDGENWEPGVTVPKEVKVQNLGNQPVVVRVRLDEKWTRENGEVREIKGGETASATGVDRKDDQKIINVYQQNENDGYWTNDDTVVEKELKLEKKKEDGAEGEGEERESLWIYGGDGWYYYVNILPGVEEGQSEEIFTEPFLESVTLAKNLDLGKKATQYTYEITRTTDSKPAEGFVDNKTVPTDCIENGEVNLEKLADKDHLNLKKGDKLTTKIKVGTEANTGYSNSEYILTITSQTVQATKDAVTDVFKVNENTPWTQPDGLNWSFMN